MEIIWDGLFFGPSGYAEAARGYVQALSAAGVRVRIMPRDTPDPEVALPRPTQALLAALQTTEVSSSAVWVQHIRPLDVLPPSPIKRLSPGLPKGYGHPQVCYTVFETDRIPAGWVKPCSRMDEVWVPCEHNRESFAASGVPREKLQVIPHVVDTERFHPGAEPLSIARHRGFQFLSVFQWQWRKGWDVLLRAYLRAFRADDDVALVLKTSPQAEREIDGFVRSLAGKKSLPPIRLDTSVLPAGLLPRLYASFDCLALPARGEGFGLPLAEAMACGLPVITTDWGGPPDFVTDDTGYRVRVKGFTPPDQEFCRATGADASHRWAEPDPKHLAELMRYVFEHREEAAQKGACAQKHVARALSGARIAEIICAQVEALNAAQAASTGTAAKRSMFASEGLRIPGRPAPPPQVQAVETRLSLLIDAPIGEPWSFGVVGTELAKALAREGCDVFLRPWNPAPALAAGPEIGRLLAKPRQPCDVHLRVCHPEGLEGLDGQVRVGITVADTTRIPDAFVPICNRMAAILAPSAFSRAVFQSHGVTAPVEVVPHGVDPQVFSPVERPARETFTFLTLAAAQKRKGTDLLIEAFSEAFPDQSDVRLEVVSNPPYRLDGFPQDDPRVEYRYGEHTTEQIVEFYREADCFALPTRAGAFEMTPLEAMATGLPTIVTGWAGPLEYANVRNAYLLHVEGMEPAFERRPDQGLWAIPSRLHLVELLRHVYTHREEAGEKGALAAREVQENRTWQTVARRLIPFLESLRLP